MYLYLYLYTVEYVGDKSETENEEIRNVSRLIAYREMAMQC